MSRRPGFLLLALAAMLFLAGCGGSSRPASSRRAIPRALGPFAFTAAQLAAESRRIRGPIFWAGPEPGYQYEFRRIASGSVFVRYLPFGFPGGPRSESFLTVATYPFTGAFSALKKQAQRFGLRATPGPYGSIVYASPRDPKNVRMAFPGVNAQIDIYDHRPAVALQVAMSGLIRPVAG